MAWFDQIENDGSTGSLQERVFAQIQDDILNGKYQPGDSLIESRLSQELGVSRTPVREALKQLELKGLVKSTPNKGTVVTGITSQDIYDIYTIRMKIEGLAARWAAEKITQEELAELKEAVELEEFYTMKNDVGQLYKFDNNFHYILFKASKSRPLINTLSTFHHYLQRARNASFSTPGRARKALKEHQDILQAIIDRDPDRAEKLTEKHIRNAMNNLLKNK